jgi:hypothetical protein
MAHDQDRLSLKRAIGISAGLHLLLVPLFTLTPLFTGSGGATGGGLALEDRVTTLSIVHRLKAHRRETVQVARAPRQASKPNLEPHRRIAPPRVIHDAPVAGVAAEGSAPHLDSPRLAHAEAGPAAPSAVPGTAQTAVEAQGPVAPTPAPTPSAVPSAAAVAVALAQKVAPERGSDASAGGWGQNFDSPMLADESDLADLKAKYHVAHITIHVDENGHAVRVILPQGLAADARDDIVQRLSALHYIPAECNGLRCAGTLTVTL